MIKINRLRNRASVQTEINVNSDEISRIFQAVQTKVVSIRVRLLWHIDKITILQ